MKVSTSYPFQQNAATANNSTVQPNRKPALFMRWLVALLMMVTVSANAQVVTVTNPANVGPTALAATYTSLALAITDLNTKTSISGPVTITLNAANPQTNPAGGYSISPTLAGASNTNRVTIAGSGNTITAPNPAGAVGAINDAIFKIIGSDFITISNFVMNENGANIINTPATSNNMVEFGVALFYATTTNGAQNNTIENCTIDLDRTYPNSMGIYSNSRHSATALTVSASATGATGGNNNLVITGNTITDINFGIIYVGPSAAADHNTGLVIGGSAGNANTISNWGNTNAFSGFNSVSGTVNAIQLNNSKGFTISHNTLTSSNGGHTVGATIRGIFINAPNNAPTGTFTNTINNNSISIRSGLVSAAILGIEVSNNNITSTSTLNVSSNNFTDITHTGSGTGAITMINIGATNISLTTNINNNLFTNITANTTSSVTFVSHAPTLASGSTLNINGNAIVTAFNKSLAGNIVTFHSTNASSATGSFVNCNNNNISNITLTGSTAFVGINNTDGGAPLKSINGNTFNNITNTTPTQVLNIMVVNFGAANSTVNNNTISNINWATSLINGLTLGGSLGSVTVSGNKIFGLQGNGGGTHRAIISSAPTISLLKNKIYDILHSGTGAVYGIEITGGTAVTIANNYIGDLRSPTTNSVGDLARGLSLTSTTTNSAIDVAYNTIYISGTNSSAQFNTSCVFHTGSVTATTAALTMRNNILVNTSTGTSGTRVAFRRSSSNIANYSTASNRNLLYGTDIYNDGGGFTDATLAAYKSRVSPRDANSISEIPNFLSTTGSSSNFLHIDPTIATGIESGGLNNIGFTDDFDGDVRFAETGYSGSGTRTDIGADEFNGTPLPGCTGTPAISTINAVASSVCTGTGTTLSLSTTYLDLGITYQWKSATVSGGPYSTILGTNSTQATGNLTATTYYICEITCTNSGLTYTTAEKEIIVNALPTVTATPSSASYCTPGGTAVSITAGGASTYAWAPASGLSATTGTSVDASPAGYTIYTVTGTDANGCVNTATTTITVAPKVSISSVTATPAILCSGNNAQLQVNATLAGNNTAAGLIYSYSSGQSFETMTSSTVETTVTNGTVDDGYRNVNLTAVPFSFDFLGTNYTTFSMGTNGYITLGGANTGIPSSLTSLSNNVFYGFGRDGNINATNGGSITHGPTATGKYVFHFVNHAAAGSGNESATLLGNFQIVFWGTTSAEPGRVDMIYGSSQGSPATAATIGIRDAAGTYINGVNGLNNSTATTSAWPASGTMYSYKIPAALSYAWTPTTFISGQETLSNPLATAVTATTTYTVTATSGSCSASGNVTVTISTGPAITSDPAASAKCVGQTATFTVVANGPGLTYQWRKGGSPISNGGNISGATSNVLTITNVSGADADTYDVEVSATCGSPVTSAGALLTINTLPVVTASPSTATVCNPGGTAVTITAGGASTYAWLPATGLSATTGSPVDANPTTTTTYTVTGTDGNGCVNSATSVITVAPKVYMNSVTAGTSPVCSGGSSTLATVAGTTTAYTMSAATFGLLTPDGSPTSLPLGDDALLATVTLPFPISFFGTVYSTGYVYSNGFMSFTSGQPTGTPYTAVIPAVATPNNFVALSHDDLNATVAGQVKYFTNGTAPNRIFVVDFTGVKYYNSNANNGNLTGQMQFFESNGSVEIHVSNSVDPTLSVKSLGIENSGGTVGYSPAGRNNAAYDITTPEAWKFVPTGGTLSYLWSETPNNSTLTSTTTNPTSASNITVATVYDVIVSDAAGCSATGNTTVTVNPNVNAGTVSGTSPLCIGGTATYSSTGDAGGTWSSTNGAVASVNPTSGLVTALTAGTTDITYTINSGCGAPVSAFQTLTVNPNVNAGTVSGTSPLCIGATATYSSNGDAGGTWSSTNGAVASVNPTSGLVTALSAGTTDITYTINTGCGAPVSAFQTLTVDPNQPVSVSIAANPGNVICDGTSVTFTATATNGGGTPTYQWYIGANPISGETASTYTSSLLAQGDAISVIMTSNITPCATGNPAPSNTITMTVNQPVAVPGAISGPLDVCPHVGTNVAITYSIAAVPGAVSYQWTVPTGATIQIGQGSTSIDVLIDNSFAQTNQQFKVRTVSADGCISAASSLIVLKNIPGIPTVINGPTNACSFMGQPTTATYSVDPVQYATSYTWAVQGTGMTLVSGQGGLSVTVSYAANFTTGVVRVTANSNCGARTPRSLSIGRLTATAPVAINGPTNACPFVGTATQVTYSIDPVPNAVSYTWTLPANTTLVSGQGTTSILVTFAGAYTTGIFKVKSVSNCFTSGDRQLTVALVAPAVPGTISGPSSACPFVGTATQVTYSITAVPGASSYLWTLPANMNLISGQGTPNLVVTFNNNFGTSLLKVRSISACASSLDNSLTITASSASTPGAITGPTNACVFIGTANQATYTIRKVSNAASYLWIVPTGASIMSHPGGTGVNDTIINVAFNNSFVGGTFIQVFSVNCNVSSPRSLAVARNTASTPGLITGPTNACEYMISVENPTGTTATYTIRKVSTALSYTWTAPANATITAHPGGAGLNDTIVEVIYNSNFTSGTIQVTATNGCGTSSVRSLSITKLNPAAPGVIDVVNTQPCPNRVFTYTIATMPSNATVLLWTVPAGAVIITGQGTTSIAVSYPPTAVNGFVTVQALSNCGSSSIRGLEVRLPSCPVGPRASGNSITKGSTAAPAVEVMKVNVFPNPTVSDFKLQVVTAGKQTIRVRMMDAQGRSFKTFEVLPYQTINVGAELKAGTYIMEVTQGNEVKVTKLIKF